MGSWNYYIEVKADNETLQRMISEYEQSQIYKKMFFFGKCKDGYGDGYNAGIMSVIDNFLPSSHLIYSFLSSYIICDFYIKTNGIERIFDFTRKSDFIKFMYDAWEDKIDFVYDQLGVIAIDCARYHKVRSKLHRKYYIRIPRPTKRDNENEKL